VDTRCRGRGGLELGVRGMCFLGDNAEGLEVCISLHDLAAEVAKYTDHDG
jgi:hypothetical protein